jgi:hypothetical protein
VVEHQKVSHLITTHSFVAIKVRSYFILELLVRLLFLREFRKDSVPHLLGGGWNPTSLAGWIPSPSFGGGMESNQPSWSDSGRNLNIKHN